MTSTKDTNELLRVDERGRVRVSAQRRAELLAEYDRSGLSGAAFARWAGMKYPTLANWLQQRRKAGGATPAVAAPLTPPAPSAVATAEALPVAWAELVVATPAAPTAAKVKPAAPTRWLRLPGGASLELDGSSESLRLAAALLRELADTAEAGGAGGGRC